MRYIIFSDLHLHSYSGEIDASTRISQRLVNQKNILQQLIDLAITNNAVLLHGGDVFHSVGTIPTEALNVYSWFLNECKKYGIKYYTATGNHDLSIRKNFSEWHNVLNIFQSTEDRNKELAQLPQKIKFIDFQDEDVENVKEWDILILHKQPECSNRYGYKHEGVNWKKIQKHNRFSFYGHFHETKTLSQFAYVIGQPMQMTQSDVGEDRGCWLVDSEIWKIDFIKLEYPELKREEVIESKEEPQFEERIKSTSFHDILQEWLKINQKPKEYLTFIEKDINEKSQIAKTFFQGKIKSLSLSNFLSWEELYVDFTNGFYLINGKNGSGKTALIDSVMWILFDESTKVSGKVDVIRNRPTKQKDAYGELKLVDNKNFYTIKRSAKDGLEVFQEKINLTEGMTKVQAQEFLERNILGFDKTVYLTACYFSQKQLIILSNLGDTEKTSMITNLLGFEVYDDLHDLMDSKLKTITLQLENLEKDSVKLENDIWKNNEQQKNLKEQIEMFTKQESSLKDEQSNVTIQIVELTTLLGNIVVPSVTTEELDNSIALLNDNKDEISTKLRTLQENGQKQVNELRTKQNLDTSKLQNILQEQAKIDKEKTKIDIEVKNREKEINKLNIELEKFSKNPERLCPTCGAKMNDEKWIYELNLKISERDNLLTDRPVGLRDFDKELNILYDQEAKIRESIDNLNAEIKKLEAEIADLISANQAEIIKIEDQIKEVQKTKDATLKEQIEANSRKENLTSQIGQLLSRQLTLVNQLKQVNINDKLLQLKELEETVKKLLSQKDTIISDKNKLNEGTIIYEFWKNAFSSKGIRPLLLDKFCNDFNSIVKSYCKKVSNNQFDVEFTPTSETRKGDIRNKIGINIIYNKKNVSYESLSGGEATLVNVPIAFALNKWISLKYGVPNGIFGTMFLDEIFGALDRQGEEKVASLLFEEGNTKFIGAITHSPELGSWTNNYWNVIKENDISTLQVI